VKDDEHTGDWKPSNKGFRFALNGARAQFIGEAYSDIAAAYKEGDGPQDVMRLLHEKYGFGEPVSAGEWKGKSNGVKVEKMVGAGVNQQLRIAVIMAPDSHALSFDIRIFWC
jgi:hypothetical protein